jgi:hypothetical protein
VNRLIQIQALQRDWSGGNPHNIFLLNREFAPTLDMLTSLEATATLDVVEALDDTELRSRCEPLVLRPGPPDSLLREALTVLEGRLRVHLGKQGVQRRDLAAKVLHPESGKLKNLLPERDRQEDFFYMNPSRNVELILD